MIAKNYGIAIALLTASFINIAVLLLPHIITGSSIEVLYYSRIYILALILGYLFYKTRSLWASIGFHFIEGFLVLNIFSFGQPFADASPLLMFSNPDAVVLGEINLGNWVDLAFTIAGIAALLAIYAYYRRKGDPDKRSENLTNV